MPGLPVATHANNHSFMSRTDGYVKVALLEHYAGEHIIIGNMSRRALNPPNWRIKEMLHGDAPENW